MLRKTTSYLKGLFRHFDRSVCYLCRGLSKTGALCAFCRRALPRNEIVDEELLSRSELEQLAVGYENDFPMTTLLESWQRGGQRTLDQALLRLCPRPDYPPATALVVVLGADREVRRRGEDPGMRLAADYARQRGMTLIPLSIAKQAMPLIPPSVLIFEVVLSAPASLSALSRRLREAGAEWVGGIAMVGRAL
jgi:predicted amidophosphoribosyltransferase